MKALLSAIIITTRMVLAGQDFSPSPDYIATSRGRWSVELPEVQELVHIIIAITPVGINDLNMVRHGTAYYDSVIIHFRKFQDDPLVDKVNSLLLKGQYARLKMDACGYFFDPENKIIRDKTYRHMSWGKRDFVAPLVKELEDFSNVSGFRQFYQNHQQYYAVLIGMMKQQMPIDKQWKWLEERFPDKYDNYRITFSPLVNGSHSTNRFESKNFRQTVMFICGPIETDKLNDKIKEGLMSRVVFTEIDHNYVNPLSNKNVAQIKSIFRQRDNWTKGRDSENYGNPVSVFNEYMTWAVFALYAYDNFEEKEFKIINEKTEAQMKDLRGFSKFREFNEQMLLLYKNQVPEKNVQDLYPKILEWCRDQK